MINIYQEEKKINQIHFEEIEWNLDEWNGREYYYKNPWSHAGVQQVGDKWVLFQWNNIQGHRPYGDVITESQAKSLLSKRNEGE